MIRKMVIDPLFVLIAGSAAAIAIVIFAAYKSTQSRTETVMAGASPSPVESAREEPIAVPVATGPEISPVGDTFSEPVQSTEAPAVNPAEQTQEIPQEAPTQIINLVPPTPEPSPSPEPISPVFEMPFQNQPGEQHATEISEPFVAKSPDTPEEAPSPFPEDTFSISPQTPAPTDVSAVANIAAPNTSAAVPSPVLVIATPKRKQPKTRRISSATSSVPRRKRSTKLKSNDEDRTSFGSSSLSDDIQPK